MQRPRLPRQLIHIALPIPMVEDLDAYAISRGISRSAAIATLLPRDIGKRENGARPRDDVQQSA